MRGKSYALVLKTLYNGESSWVVDILHNKPIDCLLVLSIDSCSFDELCLQTLNGIRLVVGINLSAGQRLLVGLGV